MAKDFRPNSFSAKKKKIKNLQILHTIYLKQYNTVVSEIIQS